jgi:hypothetical protein
LLWRSRLESLAQSRILARESAQGSRPSRTSGMPLFSMRRREKGVKKLTKM